MKALITLTLLATSAFLYGQEVASLKIKSLRSKPIIQAEINGKKGYFLVDTGSDISIINSTQLKRYRLQQTKIYDTRKKVIGFNGNTSQIMKVKNANMVFTGNFDHQNFYSINLDNLANSMEVKTALRIDGIIGADVLLKYNCIIDYNNRNITLVEGRKKHLASK